MANDQVNVIPNIHDDAWPDYVQHLLTNRFGTGVNVSRGAGERKVSGYIVSEDFAEQDGLDRQTEVYAFLQEALGPDVQGVSIILAYSPHEWTVMHED